MQRGARLRLTCFCLGLWSLFAAPACADTEELLLPTWEVDGQPFTFPGQLDDQSDTPGRMVSLHHQVTLPEALRERP
ncbi:MAG: hypothetical protein ACO3JL_21850, partial [Myxococcota bacterium]